ncbi:MAG: serine/threonine protein kinase [Deltaproteobacteria bacterium]|nr:serine/threonine protein kinase [Deltaproteobacteria bacterium]
MSRERFVRCMHCGLPHLEGERVCPVTNKEVVARPRPPKPDRDANEASAPFSILKPSKPPPPAAYVTPPPEGEPSLVGHLLESKYLVRELIGRGGMGAVYSAENQRIGKQVAIKMLTRGHDAGSSSMKRFYREARIMGSLGHPNIVEIYDLGALDNGVPFQVMELLEGQTLAARIEVEGGMPIEDAVEIGEQVLSGLEAAHQRGIVHRDLKPDNVFLAQREGRTIVKLLDFGISKTIGEETLSLTKTGMVVGTPFYLAPEQARGDDVDQRIDVWAMGVLLYEMLTGTTPFRAENYNKLIVRILTTRAEPPSTRQPRLSPELEKVIMTALSHDRDDRYADAGEMLLAFQQAKRGEQPSPPLPRERATSLDVDVSVEGEDYDPTEVSDAFRR